MGVEQIEVFVKTVAGNTRTLQVLITDTATVVKGELESKEGIPQEEQRLIFAGKQVEGVRSLAFFGVQQHSTLELLLRVPGGGPNCSKTCCRPNLSLEPPEHVRQGVGRALPLLDGVVAEPGGDAIVSFPGRYQDTWNDMVATVLLLKYLAHKLQLPEDQIPRILSTACTFLPEGDKNFGQHHSNDIDPLEASAGHCFCHKLYGKKMEWGCEWFHIWRGRLEEVLDKGQKPVVVYKAGQVGEEDDTPWERFPTRFSTEHRGLGGSQKGEVAYLRRRLQERGITHFEKRDVDQVSRTTLAEAAYHLKEIINGAAGGAAALADAIEHCKEVQDALGTLSLGNIALGEAGGTALARSLPRLRALRRLTLRGCHLGQKGGKAVATSLQHLPELVSLNLSGNDFVGEAGEALAANLRHLPVLGQLYLFGNEMGGTVGQAMVASLQHLAMLRHLSLSTNGLGEQVGEAVAASLPYVPELEVLRIEGNGLGEVAGQALAASLHNLPALSLLDLSSNNLGEEAGKALAASLHSLPKLSLLDLSSNNLAEEAGNALAASLRSLPRLSKLDIGGNDLGEEAGKALAAGLHNLPRLSELRLWQNRLGEEAGKALASGLQHVPQLTELWLQRNRLNKGAGVAFAASLDHLPLLRWLTLAGNPLGDRAKILLREKWGGRRGTLSLD